MEGKGLTGYCFEILSKELPLQRVAGLDDIENVKLLSGQDGGGIKIYQGEKKSQLTRIKAQYAGMQQTDRMGKVSMKAYGQETFSKFFKAML